MQDEESGSEIDDTLKEESQCEEIHSDQSLEQNNMIIYEEPK